MTAQIYVVDDSSFARNNMRRILQGAGYEVELIESGEAAIEMIKTGSPEIVTLDLLMPGLSGQDTLKEMMKIRPTTKYIVVTADIQEATQRGLMVLGATAFLNKPVKADILLDTIKGILEKR